MRIYLLLEDHGYESTQIHGAFSSKVKGEDAIKRLLEINYYTENKINNYVGIRELELDELDI